VTTPLDENFPRTWRKTAVRRAPVIPCACCKTIQQFKRTHGMTTSQAYKREHWPILAAWEEDRMRDYHGLVAEHAAVAKVRRDALAYCIECRNPMLATQDGFQFCPYERADRGTLLPYRQHEKVKQARAKAPVFSLVASRRRKHRQKRDRPTTRHRRVVS